jgi:hypothetical protein
VLSGFALACGSPSAEDTSDVAPTSEAAGIAAPTTNEVCAERVPVYEGGRVARSACPQELGEAGLTVIDLSDGWVQPLFSEAPDLGDAGKQPYRETMIALANEQFGDGPEWDRAREDRHLEFYGVFPTVGVVRKRLLDDERHRCHDAVDETSLQAFEKPLGPWREPANQRTEKARLKSLTEQLDRARIEQGLDSIAALKADKRFASYFKSYDQVRLPVEALAAVQAHLRCDGLLERFAEQGVYDWPTTLSMKRYQRKHMIVSWGVLDEPTRKMMLTDSRELDYRALLRVLRERVMDATGLIEDGSARGERGQVLGRHLDPAEFHQVDGHEPLPNGAPDLLAAATQVAAEALGWSSPEAARRFFEGQAANVTGAMKVAVRLPAVPSYHAQHMEVRAEVDRGDVYYDFPYAGTRRRAQIVDRRPVMTLYAKDGDREVALVRWPTTIGGWKAEQIEGRVVMKYKGSVEGDRIWRDMIVSPAWVPAESVPEREIVRRRPGGGWAANQDVFGPGYASAYGLVMFINHRVAKLRNAPEPVIHDEGIRAHGSVSYSSIQRGYSHGCHRLYNHLALRLGSFLLRHRHHTRHGSMRIDYSRSFTWEGDRIKLDFPSRGYRYELTPPVPVAVLKGRVRGKSQSMPTGTRRLPAHLAAYFREDADEE